MSFFSSTEFYVILFVTAAAIVALLLRPSGEGAVRETLAAASLAHTDNDEEAVRVTVGDSGSIVVQRTGLKDLTSTGAVSAKINIKGHDIYFYERIVAGGKESEPVDTATFELDGLIAGDRYFLRYEAETLSAYAQLTFRCDDGYTVCRPLHH